MDSEQLNRFSYYRQRECLECGRSYPETTLNIWGWIHNRGRLVCLDLKECKKHRAKPRKKSA